MFIFSAIMFPWTNARVLWKQQAKGEFRACFLSGETSTEDAGLPRVLCWDAPSVVTSSIPLPQSWRSEEEKHGGFYFKNNNTKLDNKKTKICRTNALGWALFFISHGHIISASSMKYSIAELIFLVWNEASVCLTLLKLHISKNNICTFTGY